MIARFYSSSDGHVRLFGQDIRSIPASILRGDMVVVLVQEPFIFAASMRFNVDPLNRLTDDQISRELKEIGAYSALADCAARDDCLQVCRSTSFPRRSVAPPHTARCLTGIPAMFQLT